MILPSVARELGLNPGIPVSYRAGDQPNNAFSLNVLNPGEVAATAGTSGVVYGVTDRMIAHPGNRINTFAHVNHTPQHPRLGILLCINGTGILNSWLRKTVGNGVDYQSMNEAAMKVNPGSDGLMILPFGNGAERMLQNLETGCNIAGLNFNLHGQPHLYRAAQEGIAFAFRYGLEVMKESGITPGVIRAGHANMFLSPLFRQILADISGLTIDIYDTDGSVGAAIGAAVGAGFYTGFGEAFSGMKKVMATEPSANSRIYADHYGRWKSLLEMIIRERPAAARNQDKEHGSVVGITDTD
jgi:xylulokinase